MFNLDRPWPLESLLVVVVALLLFVPQHPVPADRRLEPRDLEILPGQTVLAEIVVLAAPA